MHCNNYKKLIAELISLL